jgi:hypothetical protein
VNSINDNVENFDFYKNIPYLADFLAFYMDYTAKNHLRFLPKELLHKIVICQHESNFNPKMVTSISKVKFAKAILY